MEKKLGLSALTALVLSSMLGAGVFQSAAKYGGSRQPGSTGSSAGVLLALAFYCWPLPC